MIAWHWCCNITSTIQNKAEIFKQEKFLFADLYKQTGRLLRTAEDGGACLLSLPIIDLFSAPRMSSQVVIKATKNVDVSQVVQYHTRCGFFWYSTARRHREKSQTLLPRYWLNGRGNGVPPSILEGVMLLSFSVLIWTAPTLTRNLTWKAIFQCIANWALVYYGGTACLCLALQKVASPPAGSPAGSQGVVSMFILMV